MKTLFTKDEILQNVGSYSGETLLKLLGDKSEFTIDEILSLKITLDYKALFISNRCEFTKDKLTKFAIGCAYWVLPFYEAKYPGNKAPRDHIANAEQYLAKTIDINTLSEKRRADVRPAAYTAADAAATAALAALALAYAYANYQAVVRSASDASFAAADDYDDQDDAIAAATAAHDVYSIDLALAWARVSDASYAAAAAYAALDAYPSSAADYASVAAASVDAYKDLLLRFFRSLFKETI